MGDVLSIATDQVDEHSRFLRSVLGPELADSATSLSTVAAHAHLHDEAAHPIRLSLAAAQHADELGHALAATSAGARTADASWDAALALSGPIGTLAEEVWGFLAGDVAQLWNGGEDGLPIGRLVAGTMRVNRVRAWLQAGGAMEIPVFSNGKVGTLVAAGLERVPVTSQAGAWMPTPGATTTFRWFGVAGGAASTAIGAYDLWQQGNPIGAFERDGAGYVADVAGTAFSASTTAFLLAPNPVTGGLVVVTGVVWVGAEVVDHWDDITAWTSDRLDDLGDAAGTLWDRATPVMTSVVDGASDVAHDGIELLGDGLGAAGRFVGDTAGGLWDAGAIAISGVGHTIGGLFG